LRASVAAVRWSLLGEEGWAVWLVGGREGVGLVQAGFPEKLGDALGCLIHLDGMYLFGVYAAVPRSTSTVRGTCIGARPTRSRTGFAVDLAHTKCPAVEHR
jgi:hypothetical protein